MAQQVFAPGFMVIHGNRAEDLCEIAIDWLLQNPLAPLENETILVQSNGIAHWLRQEIAKTGIAAALNFVLPASFIWQAYKSVLGRELVPDVSVLSKDSLAWRLLRLLKTRPLADPLIESFLADADIRKYYQLSLRLADLFDQYQVYRADWLQAWQNNKDKLLNNHAYEFELDAEQKWQPALWRLILEDIESDKPEAAGRAEIHQKFLTLLSQAEPEQAAAIVKNLPKRIVVFGISSMPKQLLQALVALAKWVQVIIFVNNPCEHYWGDIQGTQELLRQEFRRQAKKPGMPELLAEEDLHNYVQPLLASWGRQGRDFINLLDEYDSLENMRQAQVQLSAIKSKINVFQALPGASLLEQIQDDIRALRPVAESLAKWPTIDSNQDRSISLHIAYGRQRELEILHDQLLDVFANNPSLKPSDVMVMVPNIENYAPHIQAVFGLYDRNDYRHLPYTVVDRGKRNADPLVIALEKLLSLPDLRFGVQEILDLLDVSAIQAKFKIDADSLSAISLWVQEANIRWGLNSVQKSDLIASPAINTNSWDFGILRMLLGYAKGLQTGVWQGIEPYSEIGGIAANNLGALVNFLSKLELYWSLLKKEHKTDAWVNIINSLLEDFFLAQTASDENTLLQFRQAVQSWGETCAEVNLSLELPAHIVANHCLSQLDQNNLSQRFFAGAITFATLMPMRAIPFKYICLLGMQDGEFPRDRTPDDFDLMNLYPRPGDRSRREDDRYLFLEAVLSARESLYISWIGKSIKDNSIQPPSVLVAQLIDHIDSSHRVKDTNAKLSDSLIIEHPLQAFSKQYFKPSQQLFTYASEWRTAQDALSLSLPAVEPSDISQQRTLKLEDMKRFLKDPVAYFYNARLGVYFNDVAGALFEDESYSTDGLELWGLRDKIIKAFLTQTEDNTMESALKQLNLSGDLPGGNYGDFLAKQIEQSLQEAIDGYKSFAQIYPNKGAALQFKDVIDGVNIADSFKNVYSSNTGELCNLVLQASAVVKKNNYRYGNIVPHWVDHLAANVYGDPINTVVISPVGNLYLLPVPKDEAQTLWHKLWQAYFTGLQQPLAVEVETAYAWLGSAQTDPEKAYAQAEAKFNECLEHNYYLKRSFPSFEQLFNMQFSHWAEVLYGDIKAYMMTKDEI